MVQSTIMLGFIGGLISFFSTALGCLLTLTPWPRPRFFRLRLTIDFALGLMLSTVAFSLVLPTAVTSIHKTEFGPMGAQFLSFLMGAMLIYGIKLIIENQERKKGPELRKESAQSELLLPLALIVHNFPEGLASGAAVAGLPFQSSFPILFSIALQNIPEGLLMVICLRSLGYSPRKSMLGGMTSGVVELMGGTLAGFTLSYLAHALPLMLMMAGGAMCFSVFLEMSSSGPILSKVFRPQFIMGLLCIPFLNFFISP